MQKHKSISRLWLILGTIALAVAGLYSLVLVVSRAPGLSDNPAFTRLFHEALVVHVDLSVLLWFLSIACFCWSLITKGSKPIIPYLEEAALLCFGLTIACMMIAPLDPRGEALMSNYIPMISSPIFFMSLGFLLCGVGFMLLKLFTSTISGFSKPIIFGIYSSGLITLVSVAAFIWSFQLMPGVIEGQQYFEMLFWGGGHVLQLTHVQIVMVCWLLMYSSLRAERSNPEMMQESWIAASPAAPRNDKIMYILFLIGLVAACAAPFAYVMFGIESAEFRQFFTSLMILAGGLAPTILALWILPGMLSLHKLRKSDKRALWSTLLMSFILFIYGNVLGAYIHGQNVVIPAHYHGSIVGVTLAFMGMAYLWLPEFGYKHVSGWRLAYWQPIIYGLGQIMHISGLAYSGGYGVLRKTPGGLDHVDPAVRAAMGFMGLGGLLAIIGGLMFVVVVFKAVRKN